MTNVIIKFKQLSDPIYWVLIEQSTINNPNSSKLRRLFAVAPLTFFLVQISAEEVYQKPQHRCQILVRFHI